MAMTKLLLFCLASFSISFADPIPATSSSSPVSSVTTLVNDTTSAKPQTTLASSPIPVTSPSTSTTTTTTTTTTITPTTLAANPTVNKANSSSISPVAGNISSTTTTVKPLAAAVVSSLNSTAASLVLDLAVTTTTTTTPTTIPPSSSSPPASPTTTTTTSVQTTSQSTTANSESNTKESDSVALQGGLIESRIPTEMEPPLVPRKPTHSLQKPMDGFGLDFLRKQSSANGNDNLLVSPLGIMLTYTMLLEGARNSTADQIMTVLRLKPSLSNMENIRNEFSKLVQQYEQQDQNFTLKMANKAVVNKQYPVKSDYKQTLEKNYLATIDSEDFGQGAALLAKLNSWVAQMTNNLIPSLFKDPPEPKTVLILINALYFKGLWTTPFSKADTVDDTFNNIDGSKSNVKMMNLRNKKFFYSHLSDENLKIIELPYHGSVSMYIMMPTMVDGLTRLIPNLTEEKIDEYLDSLGQHTLSKVMIPKFRLEDKHELHTILPAMGLDNPFGDSANFTGISDLPLKVSQSIQEAVIVVDEEGTEAAAATFAITVLRMSYEVSNPEPFILDRPFLFLLRDKKTSINLFVGVINKLPNENMTPAAKPAIVLPEATTMIPAVGGKIKPTIGTKLEATAATELSGVSEIPTTGPPQA